jgi:hypothetical protein
MTNLPLSPLPFPFIASLSCGPPPPLEAAGHGAPAVAARSRRPWRPSRNSPPSPQATAPRPQQPDAVVGGDGEVRDDSAGNGGNVE